ncbi:MAG: anti-sigma F factor, partial [Clostridia bacterium]
NKEIFVEASIDKQNIEIIIEDKGCGIENVDEAMQPFFTTKPEQERSGMGFTVMNTFMDKISVVSKKFEGTRVVMVKTIKNED